jgi:multidrug efflux pump subunit AcrA (membrane-fusion protein)
VIIMSAEHERQLLARARELADTEDLAEEVTSILGGARAARLDPDALGGLTGAALALGEDGARVYRAGTARFRDDRGFIEAVTEAEDEISGHLAAARQLQHESAAALRQALADLGAARRQLAAARAMATHDPCDGCHDAKAAAIAAAEAEVAECQERAALYEAAEEVLAPLAGRLRHALRRIGAVPEDLGETYESVYRLIRRGGVMPADGDFLAGEAAAGGGTA